MNNLAGHKGADDVIHGELTRCGLEPVEFHSPPKAEVQTRWKGQIGPIELTRAWTYWIASGPVPLPIAEKLYALPAVVADAIRAGGDAGRRPPAQWATHFDADGKRLAHDPEGKQEAQFRDFSTRYPKYDEFKVENWPHFVPNAAAVAARSIVDMFHIDTEEGLRAFVAHVKEALAAEASR
ncbi:MAG: hypothetical protein ACHREM_04180 [Polyangiales bacterium]